MSMTREDMLRELELLPVWKLRASVQVKPVQIQTEAIVEKTAIVESAVEAINFELIISDDKKWVFICPQETSPKTHIDIGLQSTLFNNILLALKIKKTNSTQLESLASIGAKVMIVMGETAARQLLDSEESIESLRGKMHTYENTPVIVTYHPNDMLQHLPNKAKAWDDLCMAFRLLDT